MPQGPFRQQLSDYILSGHAYLHVRTIEKTRFLAELKEIASNLPPTADRCSSGRRSSDGGTLMVRALHQVRSRCSANPTPQKLAQKILDLPEETIFVLKDFGHHLQSRTFSYSEVVTAWSGQVRYVLASTGRTVIVLGPDFEIPPALANDITAIESSIRFVMDAHEFDDTVPSSGARSLTRTTSPIPRSWMPEPLRPALKTRATRLLRGRQESCGFSSAEVPCDSSSPEVMQNTFFHRRSLMATAT